jgi:hypothetical protein
MRSITTTTAIFLLACLVLFATSCKKDDPQLTTQSKIQAKWKIQSITENDYYSGSSHVVTFSGPTDYADFRADGKLYSYSLGYYDTTAYSIISDTKMWIDVSTDVYDIQTLNDTQLKLYIKENTAPGEYTETTINCNK